MSYSFFTYIGEADPNWIALVLLCNLIASNLMAFREGHHHSASHIHVRQFLQSFTFTPDSCREENLLHFSQTFVEMLLKQLITIAGIAQLQ